MGARSSGTGIELRKGQHSETIRIVFQYQGKRCRETLKLSHTKNNISYARRLQGEIVNAIERGQFNYCEYFPNSKIAKALRQPVIIDPPATKVVTVGDLLTDYLLIAERNLEYSTFLCYQQIARDHLFPKWESLPAQQLTTRDLRTWIMSMTTKRKTIQLILTPMRNAIELGVAEEVLETSPFDSIKLGKILSRSQRTSAFKADPFNIDEIDAILAACTREEDRNMLLFAFCTGMRPSEYIALQWRSVCASQYYVGVDRAFVDGGNKDTAKTPAGLRHIDLRVGALDAVMAQRPHTEGDSGLVFLNPVTRNQWAGDKPIYKRWKEILTLASVRFRNPYQTRHTFASNLLMLGANQMYVAQQMGHIDTTMVTRNYGKWVSAGLDYNRRQRLLKLYRQCNPKRRNEFPKFK